MAIGKKIKQLRGEQAQEQLALAAGVSTSTLSRIERELYQPRLPTLRKIAAALNVSIGVLLEAEDEATQGNTRPPAGVAGCARQGDPQGVQV